MLTDRVSSVEVLERSNQFMTAAEEIAPIQPTIPHTSKQQTEVMKIIYGFWERNGHFPTYSEISQELKSDPVAAIRELKKKKLLTIAPDTTHRGLRFTALGHQKLKILGLIKPEQRELPLGKI